MFIVSWQLKTTVFVIFVSSCLTQEIFRVCKRDVCYELSKESERFHNKRLEKGQLDQRNDRIAQNGATSRFFDETSADSLIKQRIFSDVTRHLDDRNDERHEFLRTLSEDQYQFLRQVNESLCGSQSQLSKQESGRHLVVKKSKGHLDDGQESDYFDSERNEQHISYKGEQHLENVRQEGENYLSRNMYTAREFPNVYKKHYGENEQKKINRQNHFDRIDGLQASKRLDVREINEDIRRLKRNDVVSREVSRRQEFQTVQYNSRRIDVSLEKIGHNNKNSRFERARDVFHRWGETKRELETSRRFGEFRQEPADKKWQIIFSATREDLKSRSERNSDIFQDVIRRNNIRSVGWRSEDHTQSERLEILEPEKQFNDPNARRQTPYRQSKHVETGRLWRNRESYRESDKDKANFRERQEREESLRSNRRVIETFDNQLRYTNSDGLDTIENRKFTQSEDKVVYERRRSTKRFSIRQIQIKVDRSAIPVQGERIESSRPNENQKMRERRISGLVHERKEHTYNKRLHNNPENFEMHEFEETRLEWRIRPLMLNENGLNSIADTLKMYQQSSKLFNENNLEREERNINSRRHNKRYVNNDEESYRLYGPIEESSEERRINEFRDSTSPRQQLSKVEHNPPITIRLQDTHTVSRDIRYTYQDNIQKPSILLFYDNMDIVQGVIFVYVIMTTFNAKKYFRNALSAELRDSLRIIGI